MLVVHSCLTYHIPVERDCKGQNLGKSTNLGNFANLTSAFVRHRTTRERMKDTPLEQLVLDVLEMKHTCPGECKRCAYIAEILQRLCGRKNIIGQR